MTVDIQNVATVSPLYRAVITNLDMEPVLVVHAAEDALGAVAEISKIHNFCKYFHKMLIYTLSYL